MAWPVSLGRSGLHSNSIQRPNVLCSIQQWLFWPMSGRLNGKRPTPKCQNWSLIDNFHSMPTFIYCIFFRDTRYNLFSYSLGSRSRKGCRPPKCQNTCKNWQIQAKQFSDKSQQIFHRSPKPNSPFLAQWYLSN
jgi:hypothetical protein